MAKAKKRADAAAPARPSLAPRTRQELSAIRAEAEKLEDKYGVGTIHAMRYVFTGNKLEAEILWDHDRVNRRQLDWLPLRRPGPSFVPRVFSLPMHCRSSASDATMDARCRLEWLPSALELVAASKVEPRNFWLVE